MTLPSVFEKQAHDPAYFGQIGHRFRLKLDSRSGSNWTVIPVQTGHNRSEATDPFLGAPEYALLCLI